VVLKSRPSFQGTANRFPFRLWLNSQYLNKQEDRWQPAVFSSVFVMNSKNKRGYPSNQIIYGRFSAFYPV
jgi:hypothetical protein